MHSKKVGGIFYINVPKNYKKKFLAQLVKHIKSEAIINLKTIPVVPPNYIPF